MMKYRWVMFFLIGWFIITTTVFAEDIKLDEQRLQELIKKVIRENPKLIFEAYHQYQAQLREEQEKALIEESFKNRLQDTVTADNPVKGSGPITIIEYSDFECPYCSRASATVDMLLKKYPNKIKLVFKNYPLEMHQRANSAAKAALAAGKQGKFWEFHDLLFQNSARLSEELYLSFAKNLGLNIDQFNADRQSEKIDAQIRSEIEQARKFNITGTPAFIINGVLVRGAQSIEYFDNVIQRVLKEVGDK